MISKILSTYVQFIPRITTTSLIANPFISKKLDDFININHNFYDGPFINKTPCMEMGYIKNRDKLSIIKNMTEQINKSVYDKNPNNKICTDVYYNIHHGSENLQKIIMLQRSWFMISNDNPITIKSIVTFNTFGKLEDVDWNNFNTPNYNINESHFEKEKTILQNKLVKCTGNLDLAYIALIELDEIKPLLIYKYSK